MVLSSISHRVQVLFLSLKTVSRGRLPICCRKSEFPTRLEDFVEDTRPDSAGETSAEGAVRISALPVSFSRSLVLSVMRSKRLSLKNSLETRRNCYGSHSEGGIGGGISFSTRGRGHAIVIGLEMFSIPAPRIKDAFFIEALPSPVFQPDGGKADLMVNSVFYTWKAHTRRKEYTDFSIKHQKGFDYDKIHM